jgi:hypothetical protein
MNVAVSPQALFRKARVALTMALPLSGCLGSAMRAPEQSVVMQGVGELDMNSRRVRLSADNFVAAYLPMIELTADSIIQATDDPQVRRSAIEWKVNAISEMQRATHDPDPLVSFVDGWVLAEQISDYYTDGLGSTTFGDEQAIAVRNLRRVSVRVDSAVAATLAPEQYEFFRGFVDEWTEGFPLDNDRFARRSVASAVVDQLSEEEVGGLGAVGSMQMMALDAQQMAQSYLTYTPRLTVWELGLMLESMLDTARLAPVFAKADEMRVTSAASALLEGASELVARERAAALGSVDVITEARIEELQTIVDTELARLVVELERVVEEERAAVLTEVDSVVAGGLAKGRIEARRFVEYLLIRVVFVGVLLISFAALALYLALRGAARPHSPART